MIKKGRGHDAGGKEKEIPSREGEEALVTEGGRRCGEVRQGGEGGGKGGGEGS